MKKNCLYQEHTKGCFITIILDMLQRDSVSLKLASHVMQLTGSGVMSLVAKLSLCQ